MPKDPIEYLRHIRDECSFIITVIKKDSTIADFLADETLKRASIRSLEIIGEATKKSRPISKLNGISLNGKTWLECVIA